VRLSHDTPLSRLPDESPDSRPCAPAPLRANAPLRESSENRGLLRKNPLIFRISPRSGGGPRSEERSSDRVGRGRAEGGSLTPVCGCGHGPVPEIPARGLSRRSWEGTLHGEGTFLRVPGPIGSRSRILPRGAFALRASGRLARLAEPRRARGGGHGSDSARCADLVDPARRLRLRVRSDRGGRPGRTGPSGDRSSSTLDATLGRGVQAESSGLRTPSGPAFETWV
jgi:hypothetical protein